MDILPAWGKMKITDIKRRDILPILDKLVDRGSPIQANRLLAYVRKMFSFAVERDIIEVNPFLKMKAPSPENSCERYLSADEIKTFWKNLRINGCGAGDQARLEAGTCHSAAPGRGCRNTSAGDRGEMVDDPAGTSKNREANRVYLTDTALELIGNKEGYIFESPRNPEHPFDPLVMTKSLKRNISAPLKDKKGRPVLDKDGKPEIRNILGVAPFTPHDLRRTASTHMAELGISEETIDRVQNHVTKRRQGVTHVYVRYSYDKEKIQAMEAWERKLQSIISDKKGKVIPIRRKKAGEKL